MRRKKINRATFKMLKTQSPDDSYAKQPPNQTWEEAINKQEYDLANAKFALELAQKRPPQVPTPLLVTPANNPLDTPYIAKLAQVQHVLQLEPEFSLEHPTRFAYPHRQSQCFSKFGEVVFTLTRFFRDGESRGPTKLSLLEAGNRGNLAEKSSEHSLDSFGLEKLVSPLTTSATQNLSSKVLPSLGAKEGCVPNLGEIIPANRASLAFNDCKIIGCKNSKNISNDISHGKEMPSGVDEVIDLTGGAQRAKNIKDIQTAPSAKKRRFISGEYDLTQHSEHSDRHTLVRQIAQHGVEPLHEDNGASQSRSSRNVELLTQKDNCPPDSGPPADDETRGSAFLV
ncbi:hypothetical protein K1719_021233 [Acacia pycnantha]|nr:hypothetical protein K1719_021233 [Acacia pycnantha]